MKPHFRGYAQHTPLPIHPVDECAGRRPFSSRIFNRALALALPALLAATAAQAQYAQSQYVQPAPNYIASAPRPSPYQYPQQPDAQQQQYAPPQYAQQPQYNQQPQYSQQQPYANPGANGPNAGLDDPQYAPQYAQQQPAQPQGFAADQLEQLVAPIALYPDNLVAQILAASTYPAQVASADNWLRTQGYGAPDQIAYAADAQTGWDPSIKALTAFPQVLDLMNHDLRWTTDLGNAYYNQPQDVLQTIQVMRQRAQSAGTLQSTPQENVSDNQGYIQLAPVNPAVVYVPAYNPWMAYGQPVSPYPGFSFIGALSSFANSGVLRYGLSFAMSAFTHTPFGWAGWALNWLASNILFNHSPYYSQSTTVAHWGNPRGGYFGARGPGGINRTPNGFGVARGDGGINRTPNGFARPEQGNRGYERPGETPYRSYAGNGYAGNNVRPAIQNYAYNRPQSPIAQPARPQTYSRPGGYGNSFASGAQPGYTQPGYGQRLASPYSGGQAYRAPAAQTYQRNDFAQRAYAEPRSYGGTYGGARSYAEPKQERSHMFGGGHGEEHYKAPKAPKAPKMSGGGHGGGHGGGIFGHHGH